MTKDKEGICLYRDNCYIKFVLHIEETRIRSITSQSCPIFSPIFPFFHKGFQARFNNNLLCFLMLFLFLLACYMITVLMVSFWRLRERSGWILVYEIKFNLLVCECANILSDFDLAWTLRVYSAWTNNISGYHPFEEASVMANL